MVFLFMYLKLLLWLRDLGYTGAIEADTGLNIFNGSALQVWQDLQYE